MRTATSSTYAGRFPMQDAHHIKFCHITKTAGTSIEEAGREAGFRWGRLDEEYLEQFPYPRHRLTRPSDAIWHLPLREFDVNPYENCLVFTVVRDPYTRVVSEFYCPWFGPGEPDDLTENQFNEWICRQLDAPIHHSHLCPQHRYVFGPAQERMIEVVLHFENLAREFNEFIETYRPGCRLDRHENPRRVYPSRFSADSLDRHSVDAINAFYARDFEEFGYDRR